MSQLHRGVRVDGKGWWGPCPVWASGFGDELPECMPRGWFGRLLFESMCWLDENGIIDIGVSLQEVEPFILWVDHRGVPV